jgi:Sensors of blue-light using FAD
LSLISLLYVSRSTGLADTVKDNVRSIVAASRARNPCLGLTGALLFTGEHFAQVLEGAASLVDQMLDHVAKDPRHDSVMVVAREPIVARRFNNWSMAYCGPSQFVARHVTRLLVAPSLSEQVQSAEWLNDLLWEFAEGPGVP